MAQLGRCSTTNGGYLEFVVLSCGAGAGGAFVAATAAKDCVVCSGWFCERWAAGSGGGIDGGGVDGRGGWVRSRRCTLRGFGMSAQSRLASSVLEGPSSPVRFLRIDVPGGSGVSHICDNMPASSTGMGPSSSAFLLSMYSFITFSNPGVVHAPSTALSKNTLSASWEVRGESPCIVASLSYPGESSCSRRVWSTAAARYAERSRAPRAGCHGVRPAATSSGCELREAWEAST